MNKLLFAALTAFGRVFAVTFLFAVTGILNAPDTSAAVALSIAAFVASLVAGLRAVQVFIPQISFSSLLPQPIAAWVDSFARAFLAIFVTLLTGWLAAPDWSTWKSALLAIVIGAVTAGVRALQGLATPGDNPVPSAGLGNPTT
jgi:hypothetical protein